MLKSPRLLTLFACAACLAWGETTRAQFGGPGGGGFRGGAPGGGFGGPGGAPGGFRGGAPGGGFGGPGGAPGGFRGGAPGGGFGGPGGGTRGTRGNRGGAPGGAPSSSGPIDFLKRLDVNNDGKLDPKETEGRARYFLERIAGDAKLDLNQPISLDKLGQAFEKIRQQRSGGGSQEDDTVEESNLLAGFEAEEPPLLAGFTEGDDLFMIKAEDQDRRTAEDRLKRYDRDKDGFLSREEISSGRWSDDPFQYDRNRDGRLSASELAVRYARRRLDESGQSGGSSSSGKSKSTASFYVPGSGSSSSSSSSSGKSSSSGSVDPRMQQMLGFIMQRYDQNKNGVLDREEWGGMRSDPSGHDRNKDGKIDEKELAQYAQERFGGGGGGRGGRGGGDAGGGGGGSFYSSKDGASGGGGGTSSDDRKSYRFRTVEERLEDAGVLKDLERFLDSDRNRDGQVEMAEYARTWTDKTVATFEQFDRNGDAIVTPEEFLKSVEEGKVWEGASNGLARASSSSSKSSRGDDRKPRSGFYSRSGNAAGGGPSAYPDKTSAEGDLGDAAASAGESEAGGEAEAGDESASGGEPPAAGDIPKVYISYAVGKIRKMDANKNQVLDKSEWGSDAAELAAADADGDEKVTPLEYARFKHEQSKKK